MEIREKAQKIITYYEVVYDNNLFHVEKIEFVNRKMIKYDVKKLETQDERVNIIKELSKDV